MIRASQPSSLPKGHKVPEVVRTRRQCKRIVFSQGQLSASRDTRSSLKLKRDAAASADILIATHIDADCRVHEAKRVCALVPLGRCCSALAAFCPAVVDAASRASAAPSAASTMSPPWVLVRVRQRCHTGMHVDPLSAFFMCACTLCLDGACKT